MKASDLVDLKRQALEECAAAQTADAVERVRIKYLGRNGLLPEIMKGLKDLAPQERPEAAQAAMEPVPPEQPPAQARGARLEW